MEILAIVSKLLDLVMQLIGPEQAKTQLSEAEARFANQAADALEIAKFGKVSG